MTDDKQWDELDLELEWDELEADTNESMYLKLQFTRVPFIRSKRWSIFEQIAWVFNF